MPTGTVTSSTYATRGIWGTEEQTPVTFDVPTTALRPGTNTIAVEVHQNSRSSSDLSFDARVVAEGEPPAVVAVAGFARRSTG